MNISKKKTKPAVAEAVKYNTDLSSYSEDRLAARLTFLDIVGNGSESASRYYTEYRQILHELRRRWLPWN